MASSVKLLLDITLDLELTNQNKWTPRRWTQCKDRRQFEQLLRDWGLVRSPLDVRVDVTVTRILGQGQRHWDASSCGRGNYKELEDALVACGWWHDDGPRYIRNVDFRQDDTRRSDGPATRIVCVAIQNEE